MWLIFFLLYWIFYFSDWQLFLSNSSLKRITPPFFLLRSKQGKPTIQRRERNTFRQHLTAQLVAAFCRRLFVGVFVGIFCRQFLSAFLSAFFDVVFVGVFCRRFCWRFFVGVFRWRFFLSALFLRAICRNDFAAKSFPSGVGTAQWSSTTSFRHARTCPRHMQREIVCLPFPRSKNWEK